MFGRREARTGKADPELNLAESLAHELQTPLAEASVHLDVLRQDKLTPKQEAAVARLDGALSRARAVLEMARAVRSMQRGDTVTWDRTPVADAARIVQSVLADLKHQFSDRGIRVVFERCVENGACIAVARNLLGVAVREVVKNAYQYSFAGSVATVELSIVSNHLRIRCQNTGIAMDRDDVQTAQP